MPCFSSTSFAHNFSPLNVGLRYPWRVLSISNIISNFSYFFVAFIWNIAILSVYTFFASWLFDILGSVIGSEFIRDNSYAFALLATISMFWFGILAVIFSKFIKYKCCGSHIIKAPFPYFISFKRPNCNTCEAKVT